MPHDENNEHACTGCTACELACPNATIKVITKFDITPQGKREKALDTFVYHLDMCTMCGQCVEVCPSDAIRMGQNFEHSVFDRSQLLKVLNNPGLQKSGRELNYESISLSYFTPSPLSF
jgi:NADH-quinone oxidoreductase subunit I